MIFHLFLSFLITGGLFELLLELKQRLLKVNLKLIEFLLEQLIKTNERDVKFIAPRRLLIPDKCKPKIAKSTLAPL
jgi:hypothetical protein